MKFAFIVSFAERSLIVDTIVKDILSRKQTVIFINKSIISKDKDVYENVKWTSRIITGT